MSVRVYLLLDILERSCEHAVRTLRTNPNVILADRLEGYPNIIATVEAADRQGLAAAVMPVLNCLDGITEDLRLLVSQDSDISPDLLAPSDSESHGRRQQQADTAVKMAVSTRR